MELAKTFHYVGWLPALLGIWWFRDRARAVPGLAALLILCLLQLVILVRLGVVVGYLSDRHVLLLVLCGTFPAVAAVRELPRRLAAWRGRLAGAAEGRGVAIGSVVLLLALIGVGLPKTFQRLHGNRAGHHAAGLWLADHACPADVVKDDHCWAHYYAGCVFREGQPATCPPGHRPTCYYVVGRRDGDRPPNHGQVASTPEVEWAKACGETVYRWPAGRAINQADVVVYAVPLQVSKMP
jgi:hypothetical protein